MSPLADLSALLALAVLLVIAYTHPPRWVEALGSVTAAALAYAVGSGSGVLTGSDVVATLERLLPVVAFLVTILVVAHVCDRAGLFRAASRLLRGSPGRLFTLAFLVAALVTITLSLDATVVLLTPVVVAAAVRAHTSSRAGAYACLRMANSASVMLPISNLTNLLALPFLSLGFVAFAVTMAPVLAAVLVVEYLGLRLLLRPGRAPSPTAEHPVAGAPGAPAFEDVPVPLVPAVLVALMLAAFVATAPLGLDPWWVSATTAIVLVLWARRERVSAMGEAVRASHLEFAVLVLALGIVVSVLDAGFLSDWVQRALPSQTHFEGLLAIAGLATLLANALTNLSAALLLLPALVPLGDTAVLAALIGLNIGSGLTLGGSLANLLWRRSLVATGHGRSLAEFHLVAVVVTPAAVLAAVSMLWWVT